MRKLKRVVVKEELVALTGKVDHAIVLNQFIYWSERVKDVDAYLKEEMERIRKFSDGSIESEEDIRENLTNGWIYKTAAQMKDECMFEKSETTMQRIINDLVKNGWLDRRKNPKYKWDKTYQYRVNIYKIQRDLNQLGYALEGYSLLTEDNESLGNQKDNERETPDPSNIQNESSSMQFESSRMQNESSIMQNEHSMMQNEVSIVQNEGAIPEITSESMSEIMTDIPSDMCVEEKEIFNYIQSREDLQSHTHELINLLKKVKHKENFSYDIFFKTLQIIDFDIYDMSYFKSALNQNLKKGYVRPFNIQKQTRVEKTPDWFDRREQPVDKYERLKELKEAEEIILSEMEKDKENPSEFPFIDYKRNLEKIRRSIRELESELNV